MTRRPIWIALLAVAVLIVGALQITRSGYSVDEEFTVFAVRGIQAHGLPLLPSGLLYDRGLAYSYACWLASLLPGDDLIAARAVSLACSTAALVLIFVLLVRKFSSERLAILATAAAASSIPFWGAATTARFYGPFLLTYAAALFCIERRAWAALFVAAVFSRWTHELAFTMMALPLLGILLTRNEERGRWIKSGVAIGGGLVFSQLIIVAMHYAVPSSGETMIRRFFVWQVLNLFERPPGQQFALPLVVMLVGWLVAPRRAKLISTIALCVTAFIFSMALANAIHTQPLSGELLWSVLVAGTRYPLDMFWHIAKAVPAVMIVLLGGLAARVSGWGGDWPLAERAVHFVWLGWVLWFGVIESGLTLNYQLMPITAMLLAVAIDLHAIAGRESVATVTFMLMVICGQQWSGHSFDIERPTIHAEGLARLRESLRPSDRVVCTDELGCLMLIGRIDRWLALDDYVRERFLVRRGDAPVTGVYTGVPAAFRPAELLAPNPDGTAPERLVIVDIFKDYPIGNSRSWLPKAIEEDGLDAVPLLETPQLRVIEITPPERNARR